MGMPLAPGWTPHTGFHLYLFPSHPELTASAVHWSCCWSSGTFNILPRSPPSGHSGCCCSIACTSYLCTTVNSLQQFQILVWGPTGTPPQADESKPGRVRHMSIPEPQAKQACTQSSQPLDVSGDSVDFLIGSLTSLREIQATVYILHQTSQVGSTRPG